MRVLLLGGTLEAKQLVEPLVSGGIELVYSIAGKVRKPELPCEVLVGGFSRHGGMAAYVNAAGIDAILDATHPYAVAISQAANVAAEACGIPCWRFLRPGWQWQAGDHWQEVAGFDEALPAIGQARVPLLTLGQLDPAQLAALAATAEKTGQRPLLRTAVPPAEPLPPSITLIQAIGPFAREAERQLLLDHGVDLIVCKNSGGEATYAKLAAARELAIPVVMLARPQKPGAQAVFDELAACASYVVAQATGTPARS